jgi:hypothetical protein
LELRLNAEREATFTTLLRISITPSPTVQDVSKTGNVQRVSGLTNIQSEEAHALDQVRPLEGNDLPLRRDSDVDEHFSYCNDIECSVCMIAVRKGTG